MDFWHLINKGTEYYERGMDEYKEEYFEQAIELRKDAEFLIWVIEITRNFKTMFNCSLESDTATIFNSYLTVINKTVQGYKNNELGKDICEYILTRLLDLKAMFLKSVESHLYLLTQGKKESAEAVKLYDDFKKYLQHNKQKLIEIFKEYRQIVNIKLTEHDIDLLTAWCYVIILNDYESTNDVDLGYVAQTDGINWNDTFSSAKTTIERNVETRTYRMPRLLLIHLDEEEYRKEYIKEFKIILQKCGISEKKVLKFQKDFSDKVFSYNKDNYRHYLAFDPFVNDNIFNKRKFFNDFTVIYIPVVGPFIFVYRIIKNIAKEIKEYLFIFKDVFK